MRLTFILLLTALISIIVMIPALYIKRRISYKAAEYIPLYTLPWAEYNYRSRWRRLILAIGFVLVILLSPVLLPSDLIFPGMIFGFVAFVLIDLLFTYKQMGFHLYPLPFYTIKTDPLLQVTIVFNKSRVVLSDPNKLVGIGDFFSRMSFINSSEISGNIGPKELRLIASTTKETFVCEAANIVNNLNDLALKPRGEPRDAWFLVPDLKQWLKNNYPVEFNKL